jgi:hypothetical protein
VGTVIMHSVMSVDGFIADENDDVGPGFPDLPPCATHNAVGETERRRRAMAPA